MRRQNIACALSLFFCETTTASVDYEGTANLAPRARRRLSAVLADGLGHARPWLLGQCAQGYTDNRNILRMNERNADRRKHILGRTLLSSLVLEFSICEWKFHLLNCKCIICRITSRQPRPWLGQCTQQGYTDNRNLLRMNERNADQRKHILGRTLLLSLVLKFSIYEWKFHLFTCKCTMCRRLYRQ